MTLPDFLGIGTPRAGTTWLYELLAFHPDIFLPRAKELYFFSQYYERGTEWYEKFFPTSVEAARYRAIGEFTPEYLFVEECIDRIAEIGTINRFVVALRDPVQRAISHYHHLARRRNHRGGLVEFCRDLPLVVDRSRYAEPLARYFDRFGREKFLVLISEEMVRDVPATKRALAGHLGVDEAGFAGYVGEKRVNERFDARRPYVASLLARTGWKLRDLNAYWMMDAFKAMGADQLTRRLIGTKPQRAIPADEVDWLSDTLAPEIGRTEALLGRSLPHWHRRAPSGEG